MQLGGLDLNLNTVSSITNQFVDDDGIATYYLAQGDGTGLVEGAPRGGAQAFPDGRDRGKILDPNPDQVQTAESLNEVFPGPLGGIFRFALRSSTHVRNSTALFDEFGTTITSGTDITIAPGKVLVSYKYIDTLVNIVGVTTGYSIDIPIRIVKRS
jgi:hypothetical protein